jgi:hypothetical protein
LMSCTKIPCIIFNLIFNFSLNMISIFSRKILCFLDQKQPYLVDGVDQHPLRGNSPSDRPRVSVMAGNQPLKWSFKRENQGTKW